jgi:hypothetical protein
MCYDINVCCYYLTINVPVVYMGLVLSGFEGAIIISITRGILGEGGLKILIFWGTLVAI